VALAEAELMSSRHARQEQTRMLRQRLAQEPRLALMKRSLAWTASHEIRAP
jgi:hypothetical protein